MTEMATTRKSKGKLNDLVIGKDGLVQTAVIGVGGFLGVGQKDVAVAPTQLKLSVRSDGCRTVLKRKNAAVHVNHCT